MIARRTVLSFLPLAWTTHVLPAWAAEERSAEYFAQHTAPDGTDFFVVIAQKGERGERVVVRGVVTDGQATIPGASIYVYHADADGRYNPTISRPGAGAESPRLAGYMRSDSRGRYVFESVRPTPYPGSTIPARVHYVVSADGFKSRTFELWLEDDPLISAEKLAEQAADPLRISIRPAIRTASKVWQVTQDIVLERL
jgi:protocatechuate 3,4-dioxygenase beta subunit